MTASARLMRARLVLSFGVGLSAVLWGGAVVIAMVVALSLAEAGAGLPRNVAVLGLPAAVLSGTAAWAAQLWRGRRARSVMAVALWMEERLPALRYALVTLADPYCAGASGSGRLEAQVAATSWGAPIARALSLALGAPAVAVTLAMIGLMAVPPAAVSRVTRPAADRSPRVSATGTALAPLKAGVTPPSYTGLRAFSLDDPTVVAAVAGSTVVITGPGAAGLVSAQLADSAAAVTDGARGFTLSFAMPRAPAALRLRSGGEERIVVIEPRPDSLPTVAMTAPARDSVLRTPAGSLALSAELADDFGLGASWFEIIVSSGERESFTFRTGVVARITHRGERTARRRSVLSLDSLRLRAGDVLHLRAVASDRNDVTGPGIGVSDTRTFRVARQGEYDSISVEGLPPVPDDTSALSQRMLIMMAEALERRRPRIAREVLVGESRGIGVDQARLRRRVADVIFMRLSGEAGAEETEGEVDRGGRTPEEVLRAAEEAASRQADRPLDFAEDESPVVAVNRPLLEAYNAMWEAGRQLDIGEPDHALPHMRAALAAIQRARRAERLYLRGRPPSVVVDLARVRLAGDRAGAAPPARPAAAHAGGSRALLSARFEAAIALLPRSDAVDSLLLLRVEALERHRRFASALGTAIVELRAGREAAPALLRARSLLLGEPRSRPGFPLWEGAW